MKLPQHLLNFAVVPLVLLAPIVASAGALTVTSLNFAPVSGLSITTVNAFDFTITGITTGATAGWHVSAELCVQGYCSGGSGPQSATPTVVLTNVSISCTLSLAACPAFDLDFMGNGSGVTPGTAFTVTQSVTGTVTEAGTANAAFSTNAFAGAPNLIITQGLNQSGNFNLGPTSQSGTAGAAGFGFLGVVHLNSISSGSTLSLPNSMDVTFSNPVPEPSALGFVALGLGVLLWRRW